MQIYVKRPPLIHLFSIFTLVIRIANIFASLHDFSVMYSLQDLSNLSKYNVTMTTMIIKSKS